MLMLTLPLVFVSCLTAFGGVVKCVHRHACKKTSEQLFTIVGKVNTYFKLYSSKAHENIYLDLILSVQVTTLVLVDLLRFYCCCYMEGHAMSI